MKKIQIIYWAATIFIFLFEGLMPALTSNSKLAIDAIKHLGYPDYFRVMLTVFKVIGAIVLIVPSIKGKYKEWAYAGFGFTFIAAAVSNAAVFGSGMEAVLPMVLLLILAVSYIYYHKLYRFHFV